MTWADDDPGPGDRDLEDELRRRAAERAREAERTAEREAEGPTSGGRTEPPSGGGRRPRFDADGNLIPEQDASDPFGGARTIAEHGEWFTDAPPPREWLLGREGKGALARGIVGLLVAPGGRGKTWALCQLALSIATERPWLGTYDVATSGRVMLALAEEPLDEVRRRLYYAALAMDLSAAERRLAADRIVPLGLAGQLVGLVETGTRGALAPSEIHAALLAHLATEEHVALVFDPLARIAPDCESGNAAATGAIQALEMLTRAPGSPTVIVAHHTAQWSRREGNHADQSAGARGVTGLVDAVRWVGGLGGTKETDLAFVVSKSNYSAHGDPVQLVRDESGLLRPPTLAEMAAAASDSARTSEAREDALRHAVLATVRAASEGVGKAALRMAIRARGIRVRNEDLDTLAADLVDSGELNLRPFRNGYRFYLPTCPEVAPASGQVDLTATCPLAPPLIGASGRASTRGNAQTEAPPTPSGASGDGFNPDSDNPFADGEVWE